tara:strand:+ start:12715 stop:13068 length:354 start_codon:yes stop_codon:yes gene_type:complete
MTATLSFDKFNNIVGGELRGSNHTSHAVDPSTREELWEIPIASKQDVDDAVGAARKAFLPWRETPFEQRVAAIKAWGEACRPYLKQFGHVVTMEGGKPVCVFTCYAFDRREKIGTDS